MGERTQFPQKENHMGKTMGVENHREVCFSWQKNQKSKNLTVETKLHQTLHTCFVARKYV